MTPGILHHPPSGAKRFRTWSTLREIGKYTAFRISLRLGFLAHAITIAKHMKDLRYKPFALTRNETISENMQVLMEINSPDIPWASNVSLLHVSGLIRHRYHHTPRRPPLSPKHPLPNSPPNYLSSVTLI
ncbi:hypothetical protein CDAR_601531 [Caerostris darwini]|uniref:Uncharacterized protein n=1 Tax=Caerostris darwini TaxID=1538125 RepID=A0AAV4MZU2_9ARAC|nr:hypothetical protein CDAR_601531 [Caerostris darwini]